MAGPADFARRIATLATGVEDNADRIVRKAALAAVSTVITATPVDTGRARANWQVNMDQPAEGVVETLGRDPGPAINRAREAIDAYRGSIHREIHLTNNLPYIIPLNEGHSAQAPAGYVEEAVQAAVSAVRGARLL